MSQHITTSSFIISDKMKTPKIEKPCSMVSQMMVSIIDDAPSVEVISESDPLNKDLSISKLDYCISQTPSMSINQTASTNHNSCSPTDAGYPFIVGTCPDLQKNDANKESINDIVIESFVSESMQMVSFEKGFEPSLNKGLIDSTSSSNNDQKSSSADRQVINNQASTIIQHVRKKLNEKSKALAETDMIYQNSNYSFDGVNTLLDDVPICNFSIHILHEIVHINSNTLESTNSYYIKITTQKMVKQALLPGDKLDDYSQIKKITSGKAYLLNNVSYFKDYIHFLVSSFNGKQVYEYDRSGWINHPTFGHMYITNLGPIGLNIPYITTSDGNAFFYDEKQVGTKTMFDNIIHMMLNICKNNDISILLGLFMHLGVLTTLFDAAGFPTNFVIGLIGETNSRKTSLAMCMTQIFNVGVKHTPEINFTATKCGIEARLEKYSDAILLVDDLTPATTSNKHKELVDKVEFLIRAYGDRVSKIRMTFDDSPYKVAYPIRGCCVMTGEFIDGIQSSMTRMITLSIDKTQVNNEILSYYQNNYKILPTHIYDFLDYVSCNYDQIVSNIKLKIPEIRRNMDSVFHTARYAESFAQFACASEILLSYALQRGFISNGEYGYYSHIFYDSIHRVILQNDYNIIVKNPATMFLMALQASIDSGRILSKPLSESKHSGNNCIYFDDELIYIKPDMALLIAITYWRNLEIHFPATSTETLSQHLASYDVIKKEYEGKDLRLALKLPGRAKDDNRRFYRIIKTKMNEMLINVNSF